MGCKALPCLLLLGALLGCASAFKISTPTDSTFSNTTVTIPAPGLGPQNISTSYGTSSSGFAVNLVLKPGEGVATVINFPAGIKTLVSGINSPYSALFTYWNVIDPDNQNRTIKYATCALFTDTAGYQMLSAMSSAPTNCSNLPALGYLRTGRTASGSYNLSQTTNSTFGPQVIVGWPMIENGITVDAPADGKLYVIIFATPQADTLLLNRMLIQFTLTNDQTSLPPLKTFPPPPAPPPSPPLAGSTVQPQRLMALLSAAAGMLLCFMSLV